MDSNLQVLDCIAGEPPHLQKAHFNAYMSSVIQGKQEGLETE